MNTIPLGFEIKAIISFHMMKKITEKSESGHCNSTCEIRKVWSISRNQWWMMCGLQRLKRTKGFFFGMKRRFKSFSGGSMYVFWIESKRFFLFVFVFGESW